MIKELNQRYVIQQPFSNSLNSDPVVYILMFDLIFSNSICSQVLRLRSTELR